MEKKMYTSDELRDIAKEIMESLRPKHLTVLEIKSLAMHLVNLTGYIVLREAEEEPHAAGTECGLAVD